ncbi:MAG: hypothetical protein WB566_08755 [Terriglobales bacterium]
MRITTQKANNLEEFLVALRACPDDSMAEQLGRNGHQHVKENFLMTTDVRRWLILLRILLQSSSVTPLPASS